MDSYNQKVEKKKEKIQESFHLSHQIKKRRRKCSSDARIKIYKLKTNTVILNSKSKCAEGILTPGVNPVEH